MVTNLIEFEALARRLIMRDPTLNLPDRKILDAMFPIMKMLYDTAYAEGRRSETAYVDAPSCPSHPTWS